MNPSNPSTDDPFGELRQDAADVASSGGGSAASDGGASSGSGAAGTADAADAGGAAASDARPFAKDPASAEAMIDDAIDSRHSAMDKCATDARKRGKDPHKKISLLIGIDQEGNLLGVKRPSKKDNEDEALLTCVRAALHGAPFPKSHAGVITIKKTYEETLSTTSTNPNITPN